VRERKIKEKRVPGRERASARRRVGGEEAELPAADYYRGPG
jgi:hypothetical protein